VLLLLVFDGHDVVDITKGKQKQVERSRGPAGGVLIHSTTCLKCTTLF
jgi:hypothetical protein